MDLDRRMPLCDAAPPRRRPLERRRRARHRQSRSEQRPQGGQVGRGQAHWRVGGGGGGYGPVGGAVVVALTLGLHPDVPTTDG